MDFTGIVIGGSAKAKILGFPTANIPLKDPNVSGIYAACVDVWGKEYSAVAFADPKRGILEAHLFNFSDNLYGKEITITLVKKIRESQAFASDADLKEAMRKDADATRDICSQAS